MLVLLLLFKSSIFFSDAYPHIDIVFARGETSLTRHGHHTTEKDEKNCGMILPVRELQPTVSFQDSTKVSKRYLAIQQNYSSSQISKLKQA